MKTHNNNEADAPAGSSRIERRLGHLVPPPRDYHPNVRVAWIQGRIPDLLTKAGRRV